MLPRFDPHRTTRAAATLAALLASVTLVIGQTKIVAPDNKYNPQEDVTLGLEAAKQVEEQMPLVGDNQVESYVNSLGDRVIDAIPPEFQHREFHYSFKVVNVRDINAFALPGGPMYVNRGMIEAAGTEGEVVGVIAHEISHVALRHGTAQATKATKYEIGSLAGQIFGAIIGGTAGSIVSQGTQFGLGTAFLRFSREFEKQADLLGAQMMARAGYDARDMADMFRTIEKTSGNGGPQFLSDHPNPSNRYKYIEEEAQALTIDHPVRDAGEFAEIKARLKRMAPAPTTEQVMRDRSDRQISRVESPSSRYRTYNESGFRVSVPSNWRELVASGSARFAPERGYGNYRGQTFFTHGVEIGVEPGRRRDLRTATEAFVDELARNNRRLRRAASYSTTSIDGRRGLHTILTNVSASTGQAERIALFTTQLGDGSLFHVVGVAPADEFSTYEPVFSRIVRSIQLSDAYRNSRY